MPIKINNIFLDIEEPESCLEEKLCNKLRLKPMDIMEFKIIRKSIDARKKDRIRFNYSIELKCYNEKKIVKNCGEKDVFFQEEEKPQEFKHGEKSMKHRPVIVGMGPAGLFAGLILSQNGYRPIIIERGEPIEDRTNTVNNFWKTGKLNPESNVQFGEGGAGTFSDGKLTTRIKDKRCDLVLKEFVKAGAPFDILYSWKPHIGTDILKTVVVNIREQIIKLGGEVRFSTKLQEIKASQGEIYSIIANGEEIYCENLILSIGHSARDTYSMLFEKGITLEPKAFAMGVRIEHPRSFIDESQYGRFHLNEKLGAANYTLTHFCKGTGRSVYSFCMCPGGEVVAASSSQQELAVNGMSYYKRDLENSNSALVATVDIKDFGSNSPLSGIEFQRNYERLAYNLGGGNYKAPVQLVEDFLEDKISSKIKQVTPSYSLGYNFADMRECLPSYVVNSLKEGIVEFDKKIKGFATNGAVITGIETRTSAPVRILRGPTLESVALKGLYPAGEGAGYAGGIISAAVDGIKCAENIMKEFSEK